MVLAPTLLASQLAGVYLVWEPPSADLAAQTFRADLFADHGFTVFNSAWYAGHHVPAYSLLFPPLASAVGPRLVGALAAIAAAALFAGLTAERYGEYARLGSLWFGAATAVNLFTGRLTFALGLALGLGALFALLRGHRAIAGALALLTGLASPVAGLFACLAGAAVALTGDRRGGGALLLGAGAAVVLPALAFPTSGVEPWETGSFIAVPLAAGAALFLLPREERALRTGAWLYAAAAVLVFTVSNPVGANMGRLGALVAGPLLAVVLAGRRSLALAVVALPLLYWQWISPVRDLEDAVGDPSTEASYYAPVLERLDSLIQGRPVRIHVPPTRDRWEAVYVAERYPLARGWLRQLESDDFDLFQDGNLTPALYRQWLFDRAVSYVAVPDAQLDYLAKDEAELIGAGLPYLREAWRGEHWTLYRVAPEPALVSALALPARPTSGARLATLGSDFFQLTADRPGDYLVRVRHTPYWRVSAGDACVGREGDWTRVTARAPSVVRVQASFSLDGLVGEEESC
jgi:hypothetical protein